MLLYACPRVRLLVLESELGEGGLSRRVQRRWGGVWPVAGEIDWDDLDAFFDFREELHPPDAPVPFAPTFERCFSVFADFVCECGVVAECDGGLDTQAGKVSERLVFYCLRLVLVYHGYGARACESPSRVRVGSSSMSS